jgi:adenylate cyclase
VIALVAISALSAAAAVLMVAFVGFARMADLNIQDFIFANFSPLATDTDDKVKVVKITEDTLRSWGLPFRNPIDRSHLAALVRNIASKQPRAIGIDILFDQSTIPKEDDELKALLRTVRVPVVVSYSETIDQMTPEQKAFLNSFVPRALWGEATLPPDEFGGARSTLAGKREPDGDYVIGFARAIAAKLNVSSPAQDVPIAWHGVPARGVSAFDEYEAQSVIPKSWIEGKVVLIGTSLSLREDKHRTPFAAGLCDDSEDETTGAVQSPLVAAEYCKLVGSRRAAISADAGWVYGVVVQANIISQYLDGRSNPRVPWTVDLVIAFLLALVGGAAGLSRTHIALRIAGGVALLALFWAGAIALYHLQPGAPMFGLLSPSLASATAFFLMESVAGREDRLQRQFIQGMFSRYVTPEIVDELVRDPTKAALSGVRREMTFLFTDVADFTTMSEKVDASALAPLLNAYFEGATQIVLDHGGMVDKYIGDAVFAIFNAPLDLADHPTQAVRCALALDTFCENFRHRAQNDGTDFGLTRIGVNTGSAVIGNFGSNLRYQYTAQGDAVNVAARLEGLNKQLGTRICVSSDTKERCTGITFRFLGSSMVKGKTHPIDVWEPLHDPDGITRPTEKAAPAAV